MSGEEAAGTARVRKGIYFSEEGLEALAQVRKKYSLTGDSDPVNFALLMLADPEAVRRTVNERRGKKVRQAFK